MKRVLTAIAIALLVHAVVGALLVVHLACGTDAQTAVTLDLSSVDLSFAEEDAAEAPAVAPEPPPPPEEAAPPDLPPPPEVAPDTLPPRPPDPDDLSLPEPAEPPPKMPETVRPEPPRQPEATAPEKPVPDEPPPTPAVAPRQAKIDAPPKQKRSIRPDYPLAARLRGEQGSVTVRLRINARGTVDEVTVVASSGFADLDAAAVKAVKAASFVPAKSGRVAVASEANLSIDFKLD